MGKMRVHELAKELGKDTADVIGVLAGMGIKATAASGVEEADCEKVRRKLSGQTEAQAKKPSAAAQESQSVSQGPGENGENGQAPKKKRLVAVFRPQNARSGVIAKRPPRPERPHPVDANGRPLRRRPVDANGRPLRRPVPRPAEGTDTEAVKTGTAAPAPAQTAPAEEAKTVSAQAVLNQAQAGKVLEAKAAESSQAAAPTAETVSAVPAEEKAAVQAAPETTAPAAEKTVEVKKEETKDAAVKDTAAEASSAAAARKDTPEEKTAGQEEPVSGKKADSVEKAAEKEESQKAESRTQDGKSGLKDKDSAPAAQAEGKETPAPEKKSSSGSRSKTAEGEERGSAQNTGSDRRQGSQDRSQNSGKDDRRQGGDRSRSGAGSDRRDRSQGSGSDRRQGSGDRYQGSASDRRQGSGDRYQGSGSDRRQGSGDRTQGSGSDRRQGSGDRYQGSGSDRRQGSGDRYQGAGSDRRDRSQGSGSDRRQGSGDRYQGAGSTDRRASSGQSRPEGRFAQGKQGASKAGFADAMPGKSGDKNRNRNTRRNDKEKEKFDRFEQDGRTPAPRRKKDPNRAGAFHKPEPVAVKEEEKIRTIVLPESITVKELAEKMKIQASQIIKKLFLEGKMVTVNQELSYEEAEAIALEYEILCEQEEKKDLIADLLKEDDEAEEKLVSRPPVVCVMGHVDHGKTSLLDAIRDTHVIDREAGGITQHIGASVINYNDRTITFLDTPGHEAFTAMRMRGANSTDIAVLVVAADDGVMPQTIEAINHAKAAGIEIIVAINKIDKPSANVDRVKQELTEYELVAEDWGGSTVMVPVSAKTHEGIDDLLEMILLTADVMELKSNPDRRARGLVIEAKLDKGRGPVASVLVQKGTLHVGDPICAGPCYGKVRAMTDDKGRRVKEAGPSMPVEVIGFSDVPGAGEIFTSPETEKEAKTFAETFYMVGREKMLEETRSRMSLDDLFSQIKEGTLKELNLIVKADVQGSVEAVKQSLLKLSNDEVVVKVIHSAVGAINESDVSLAGASNAIIIGFNVRPDVQAKSTAEHEGVDIRLYRVIYDAINDVENAMKGMLDPIYEEKVTGHVEVRQIFKASGIGSIAGSYVLDGIVQRGSKARITRDSQQIFDGQIASLKRFKDDVKEVRAGYECGLVFDGFNDIREGDLVEVYVMVEVPR